MRLRALSQYEGQASLDGSRDLGTGRSEDYVIGYLMFLTEPLRLGLPTPAMWERDHRPSARALLAGKVIERNVITGVRNTPVSVSSLVADGILS